MGSQGTTMSARRSRPIHLRRHQVNREIPIRDRLSLSSAAPPIGRKSIVSRRIGRFPLQKKTEQGTWS
jgi:hypothetical protein